MQHRLKADFLSWQKLLATIFLKRNQSSDNRSHSFGTKFLLKKLSASNFSYERKSAFRHTRTTGYGCAIQAERVQYGLRVCSTG